MADYADTALSTSRPERSAPWKRRASSDSSVVATDIADPLTPDADAGIAAREALLSASAAAAAAAAASVDAPPAASAESLAPHEPLEPEAPVRQGTLSGFEMPEHERALNEETNAAPARRAPRGKDASAPLDAPPLPEFGDIEPQRVEPTLFAAAPASTQFAPADEPPTLASRIDALHAALADQQRVAAASARRLKWTLAAAVAAVVATLGFGIAQSVRFDSFANESRAETARLEQLVLSEHAALEGVSQRLAEQAAAAAAARVAPVEAAPEAPAERPAAARTKAAAKATKAAAKPAAKPAAAHRAPRAARAENAHHAQKPAR